MTLLFEVWNYAIFVADRYGSAPYYKIAPLFSSSDYMDTYVRGTLTQLVPVAPKARPAGS